jgi:hypothetical protein
MAQDPPFLMVRIHLWQAREKPPRCQIYLTQTARRRGGGLAETPKSLVLFGVSVAVVTGVLSIMLRISTRTPNDRSGEPFFL